jgi:hypothetical protein
VVERITVIKIRGSKRIGDKNSSFQIKGGANLAKQTDGVIRTLTDRRNLLRKRKIRIKDDTKITSKISRR